MWWGLKIVLFIVFSAGSLLKIFRRSPQPSGLSLPSFLRGGKLPSDASTISTSGRRDSTRRVPTKNYTGRLVVLVLSDAAHIKQRAAIRDTWGRANAIFVVGTGSRLEEADDFLECNQPESYASLPFKLHCGLKWVASSMPSIQWVVKMDDDMYGRIEALEQYLDEHWSPRDYLVLGDIIENAAVVRQGLWADSGYTRSDTYPPWPKGSAGYVLSRPLVDRLAHRDVVYYQGEDTSLGIWLQDDTDVRFASLPNITTTGRCLEKDWFLVGHKLRPSAIRECYRRDNHLISMD